MSKDNYGKISAWEFPSCGSSVGSIRLQHHATLVIPKWRVSVLKPSPHALYIPPPPPVLRELVTLVCEFARDIGFSAELNKAFGRRFIINIRRPIVRIIRNSHYPAQVGEVGTGNAKLRFQISKRVAPWRERDGEVTNMKELQGGWWDVRQGRMPQVREEILHIPCSDDDHGTHDSRRILTRLRV